MIHRTTVDLLAERRALVDEARRTENVTRAALLASVAQIDAELERRRDRQRAGSFGANHWAVLGRDK